MEKQLVDKLTKDLMVAEHALQIAMKDVDGSIDKTAIAVRLPNFTTGEATELLTVRSGVQTAYRQVKETQRYLSCVV